jgi:hypothetical protein
MLGTERTTCRCFLRKFRILKTGKKKELLCLVDSGAGATLINDQYAEALGIDLKAGREVPITGIEDNPVTGYGHTLTIKLGDELPDFSVMTYFVPNLTNVCTSRRRGDL